MLLYELILLVTYCCSLRHLVLLLPMSEFHIPPFRFCTSHVIGTDLVLGSLLLLLLVLLMLMLLLLLLLCQQL